MKKFSGKISAFCVFAALFVLSAAIPAFAKADSLRSGGDGESREEKTERGETIEQFMNELALFLVEKAAAALDEIAGSLESRIAKPKSPEKEERKTEQPPDNFEERLSEKVNSFAAGLAGIFSEMINKAAQSVRKHLKEKILPKLMPQNLLVYHSYRRIRAVV